MVLFYAFTAEGRKRIFHIQIRYCGENCCRKKSYEVGRGRDEGEGKSKGSKDFFYDDWMFVVAWWRRQSLSNYDFYFYSLLAAIVQIQ